MPVILCLCNAILRAYFAKRQEKAMIEVEKTEGPFASIRVGESITSDIANSLKKAVEEVIEKGARDVAINLEGVEYVTSWGICVITEMHSILKSKGGGMKLVKVSQTLLDFFEDINLHVVLPIQ